MFIMEQSLAETLKGADREVLQEILREAESRLSAQLTAAIAADTRAMTFLGFISAVAVATIGAALAIHQSAAPELAYLGLFIGGGDRVPLRGVAPALAVPSGQSRELISLRLAG
ncbi:hypothetical protein ASE36_18920 [Rhizobium sp. Root274]|nr:hypothetical protein ASC71_18960 [Rhizobium sp. Root1240]KRD27892.1 hypothetical protein ASE36_18920 [Rhizobium sp. Root274]